MINLDYLFVLSLGIMIGLGFGLVLRIYEELTKSKEVIEMVMWKEIKCKGCGSQDKKLFMVQPPLSAEDCWCEECKVKEMEKRAKA